MQHKPENTNFKSGPIYGAGHILNYVNIKKWNDYKTNTIYRRKKM